MKMTPPDVDDDERKTSPDELKPPPESVVDANENDFAAAVRMMAQYNRELHAPEGMLSRLGIDVGTLLQQNAARAKTEDANWANLRMEVQRVGTTTDRVEQAQRELRAEVHGEIGGLKTRFATVESEVGALKSRLTAIELELEMLRERDAASTAQAPAAVAHTDEPQPAARKR